MLHDQVFLTVSKTLSGKYVLLIKDFITGCRINLGFMNELNWYELKNINHLVSILCLSLS